MSCAVWICQRVTSFWVEKMYFTPFHQGVSTHGSCCPRSQYASCPQRPRGCCCTIIKRLFPLLRNVFTPPCPPPTAPVLCLWCYSWSWGPHLFCRCGSRIACNHMTGRCRCWPGGSPCLVAALTCMAGRTVSSDQTAFQRQHLLIIRVSSRWGSAGASLTQTCWVKPELLLVCNNCHHHVQQLRHALG